MIKQEEIASFYRQVSATGANPAGLVVKLYDAILEDFRRAIDAIVANKIKERVARLNHALLIIAELDSVLDFERGGVVAQHLRGFYSVMRGLIIEANVRANRESVERLIDFFMPLRKAWQQVEQDIALQKIRLPAEPRSVEPAARPVVQNPARPAPLATAEPDGNESHWSA